MSLKIYHCADLHLGLRFARYPDEVSARLREARFATLERMVDQANREGCDLFVVAGDLFDHLKVPQRDVARAAKILAGFERVAAVLPGNHDFHAGPTDEFWKRFELPEHGRLLLLDRYRPYPLQDLGVDAVLYPSHCNEKRSENRNALAWLEGAERLPGLYQIGIAHGSFEGLSPDLEGDYFPMTAAELERCRLDLWLLGHIHVQHPPKASATHRIFYSGTHEPDGLDCRHEGKAWLIELSPDKAVAARSLSTGECRFLDEAAEVRSRDDLEGLLARYPKETSATLVLRLRLTGSLPKADFERVAPVLEELRSRVLSLQPDFSALSLALTPADIDRDFAQGSFSHRLLTELSRGEDDHEALQAAYELLREAGR
jgi:DNA repair exonuclease SbcCD nuclease subunit